MANTVSRFPLIESGAAWSIASPLTVNYFNEHWGRAHRSKIVFRRLEPEISYRTAVLIPRHRNQTLLAQDFTRFFTDAVRNSMHYPF